MANEVKYWLRGIESYAARYSHFNNEQQTGSLWLRMRKKRQKPLKNKNAQIFMKLHNLNVENLCIKKI